MSDPNITQLLHDWVEGNEDALNKLTPLVYEQLLQIARRIFSSERQNHTLQPTALVHEAYARLVDVEIEWQDRTHFYALAARLMRRILVDHANSKVASKRGGSKPDLPLDDVLVVSPESGDEILELHEALNTLAKNDQRKADILELHYFGGLTYEEMSGALRISSSTLDREMRFAKAWLRTQLEK